MQNFVLFELSICAENPIPTQSNGNAKKPRNAAIFPAVVAEVCGRNTKTAISATVSAINRISRRADKCISSPLKALRLASSKRQKNYFASERQYSTSPLTCSGFRVPYFGILPFPLVMMPASSSSDEATTAGSAKLRAFIALPAGVSPLPSAPWQETHFCL